MLDKKQIRRIFKFVFKMVVKQRRQLATSTTRNINNASGPGTANECKCSGGSRSAAKETRAVKMASHWKLTMTSWEQSPKLILLQLPEKLPSLAFEANWKGEKAW